MILRDLSIYPVAATGFQWGGVYMQDCIHENFKPRPLQAHFLAQNELQSIQK